MTAEEQSVDRPTEEQTEEQVSEQIVDEVVGEEDVQAESSESDTQTLDGEDNAEAGEEVTALRDQLLRSQAEMQNLRRRMEKDVESAHKFGQEKLIKELLPVIDNLERALESTAEAESGDANVLEGVKMTRDIFLQALAKFEVVAIEPQGEPFDPQLHQAMSMVENPEVEPNTVIAVMQKGYTLHGRLIRPAMVMVSKGGAGKTIDEKA